jgi:type IV secretory pathway VirB10-like protein
MAGPDKWLARLRDRPAGATDERRAGTADDRDRENSTDHANRPDWTRPRPASGSRNWLLGSIVVSMLVSGFALVWRNWPTDAPPPVGVPDVGPSEVLATLSPPLDIEATGEPAAAASSEPAASQSEAAAPPPPPPVAVLRPDSDPVLAAPLPAAAATPESRKPGPVLIFDAGAPGDAAAGGDPAASETVVAPKVSMAAPSRSVRPTAPAAATARLSRGTLIPAVLESVIDANQPGGVRAMVSTDVRTADGRGLLVPRSSRLVGHYRRGDGAAAGRTYVIWTRIERPDGSRVPLAAIGRDGARFHTSYASAPVVSQVGGGDGKGAVRVRQGEPIRVVAAHSVDVAPVAR